MSVRKGFAKLFESIVRESKAQHERGCLLMNANLSRAVDDIEVKNFLGDNQKDVERIFRTAFVEAKKRGEIGPEKDPITLSRFFVATIQGMRALARLNHNREELAHVAAVALAALD